MIIFPDIELQNGKCVNLVRGQMDQPVVYERDPMEAAKEFAAGGAQWLHVVDLDAADSRETDNSELICEIIKSVHVPVQVAGGIRSIAALDWWIERGAERVVVLTPAAGDPPQAAELRPDEATLVEGRSYHTASAESVAAGTRLAIVVGPVERTVRTGVALVDARFWLELDDAALVVDERYNLENTTGAPAGGSARSGVGSRPRCRDAGRGRAAPNGRGR